ncbi:MAG: iron transporter [Puniceicoccaceae bacterium MED-G30]|mgnify:CR=1 FL=1|jgi:ferrous iron transport protein A|nr:MAG: iron transporter [Puniceicoccaceae bacterium MED-G30]RPG84887.1 MAG: ferrous iron transport protein A [Coraliomargarita sp. TMED73]|tara:strand:+ start:1089 stop:1313 length:225 start_codon:yes stop_codon:yes gene_type:complete
MRLDQIAKNGNFRVVELDSENRCVARLMSMGLLPQQSIRLTHEAPLGDPIAIEFNGCQMSLRLTDAKAVEVEPL